MNNCKKCKATTNYYMGYVPLCFNCICEVEKMPTVSGIIKKAEIITGISYEKMKQNTRKRDIVEAKWYAMKMLYESGIGSLSFVGDLFGNDHSSVLFGIKKINVLIETDQVKYGN